MKAWSTFHPHVLPDVVGCPLPTVDRALCDAAREFCMRTRAWKEWADPYDAPGNTNRFDFDPPSGAELVAATRASVAGEDVRVLSNLSLPSGWETDETVGEDGTLVHIDLVEFLLYPRPSAGDAIHVEMALQPTVNATSVGDVLYDTHAEALAYGAKYRLLRMPRTDWTDRQLSVDMQLMFERAIHSAANQAYRTAAPAQHRVRKARL